MIDQKSFYIPIDEPINDFLGHLEANPRTILSSKFGDGKSYFLNSFIEHEEVKEIFEFITLYPVNYQVVENKDIFDLIKVDLLFQLFCHGMISDRVVLKNDVALAFYIQNNGLSLAEVLMPFFAEVALDSEQCSKVLMAFKGLKLFKDLRSKFLKFKEKFQDEDKITSFIDDVNSGFLYENDVVTEIIQNSINDYKRRTGKRVALIIEDLDRIAPAHLFRILNVLSAHLDRCYRFSVEPRGVVGNKFDIDNIVLVVDFSNLENIFHHFYGEKTDFNGYISKFLTSTPFNYSLKETATKYYKDEIARITGAPKEIVDLIDPNLFEGKTIRDAVKAFNINKQISKKPIYKYYAGEVELDTTILKILSFLRRLKLDDQALISFVVTFANKNLGSFCCYVCPYVFLIRSTGIIKSSMIVNYENYPYRMEFQLNPKNGQCTSPQCYRTIETEKPETHKIASFLLTFIRK